MTLYDNSNDTSLFLVDIGTCLRDVVVNLNKSKLKIVFVCQDGKVIGTISDGDLRRAFLSEHTLESPTEKIVNRDFISADLSIEATALQDLFTEGIDVVPVLDATGALVRIVRRNARPNPIPVASPDLTSYEHELVLEALNSGWVSSIGRFVTDFEEEFADYVGVPAAVSVSSGTSALALAMWTLGLGPGDDVIVPDLTFGATANAVLQVGARPVLADIARPHWSLDKNTIEAVISPKTRAIVVVHLYGIPAPMEEIWAVARKHDLVVIEDCAEALGTRYKGVHVGSLSDAGTFSFFGNKTITTGEGGMVTFSSAHYLKPARTIRSHGMSNDRRYWHEIWGTNLRLTNLQAALGVAQLRRLPVMREKRKQIAQQYSSLFSPFLEGGLELPDISRHDDVCPWLYSVLLPIGCRPDAVAEVLLQTGIETRRIFYPLHQQPAFRKFRVPSEDYFVSQQVSGRGLSLPTSSVLTQDEVGVVVQTLATALETLQ